MTPVKHIIRLGVLSLLLFVACFAEAAAGDEQTQQTAVKSDALGALLLEATTARLLKDGQLKVPLRSLMDRDGFAATQYIGQVADTNASLTWTLAVGAAGRYAVALEYAHPRSGNTFELSVGDQKLEGLVVGTGSRAGDFFAIQLLGEVTLQAGRQTIQLRNLRALDGQFMSVGSLYIYPAGRAMSLPEVRGAIAAGKPRAIPQTLAMPGIFSDHMVLQRERPVPIWGLAAPGTAIEIEFAGQTQRATANAQGRWRVALDPMPASASPRVMTVRNAGAALTFADVLVGEVWLGSGQSNMEWGVDGHPGYKTAPCDAATQALIGEAKNPLIRISAITRDHLKTPGGGWMVMDGSQRGILPALMTCTAILLQEELKVPVGVIVRCESSSPSGIWLSRDAVEGDQSIQRQIVGYAQNTYPALMAEYQQNKAAWDEAAARANVAGEKPPRAPRKPAAPGYSNFDCNTYGLHYARLIEPVIPYAMRGVVWDQGENGTGIAGAEQADVMRVLIAEWRHAWGLGDFPFIYIRKKQYPADFEARMNTIPHTAMVDNQGLRMDLHPLDKAAYARRVVEKMQAVEAVQDGQRQGRATDSRHNFGILH